MTPERIQFRKTKDWQMPLNCVNVGKGTIWATPFKVTGNMIHGVIAGRPKLLGQYILIEMLPTPDDAKLRSLELYEQWVNRKTAHLGVKECPFTKEEVYYKLRGKHLSCTCKQGELCHGDVLLKIAQSYK